MSVTGSISVDGIRESLVEQVSVTPVDADRSPLLDLEWSPQRVEVRIGVQRKVGYKPDVQVVPDLRGQPAPGYRLGSVTVQPSTVTLVGLPSVLNDLPGFVETLPISVTDATQNLTVRSLLTVPASVVVVDTSFVTVLVEVLPIQSSRALSRSVEIQGVRPGWQATASPGEVDVILEGPDALLVALTPDDIQITVNAFDLDVGVHRIIARGSGPRRCNGCKYHPRNDRGGDPTGGHAHSHADAGQSPLGADPANKGHYLTNSIETEVVNKLMHSFSHRQDAKRAKLSKLLAFFAPLQSRTVKTSRAQCR